MIERKTSVSNSLNGENKRKLSRPEHYRILWMKGVAVEVGVVVLHGN